MASDEPAYLKAIREEQERKRAGRRSRNAAPAAGATMGPAEREAIRWAREVADRDPQIVQHLAGAKCALLFKPASIDGRAPVTLEGVADREALVARLRDGESRGQEVLGCFELTTARPLTPVVEEGKVRFKAGPARATVRQMSPEQMLRKAAAQAAEQARTRRPDDLGGRGQGGAGGRGRSGRSPQGGR